MNGIVTIDKAGRVIVPKPLRDALHLKAGDQLEIESDGEAITLRQRQPKVVMKRKNGFWVFGTGGRITTETVNDVLNQTREEREGRILGE